MQSRENRDAHSPDPCPHDGEVFAHLGPHHGKGGKSWVTYLLAVGVTVLQTQPFSDSCEDNSPELGPLGGGLVPRVPPPFPRAWHCPLPPGHPRCWWRGKLEAPRHTPCVVLHSGWGSPRVQWRGHTSLRVVTLKSSPPPPAISLQGDPML